MKLLRFVDLNELSIRGKMAPDGQANPIHIYGAPRDFMVETGDIVYRRLENSIPMFYRVTYAHTERYPKSACGKVCAQLPYQLFIRREKLDATESAKMAKELDFLHALPY
ncbi:MAG: hypothetical protein AAGA31_08615 [Bacteroidota bacterium]